MKIKKFKDLSDDIVALSKLDDGTYEEIKEPITILQITGLITDEKELNKIEEAFTLDTSLSIKNIKITTIKKPVSLKFSEKLQQDYNEVMNQ
jgi:hypothetical protein